MRTSPHSGSSTVNFPRPRHKHPDCHTSATANHPSSSLPHRLQLLPKRRLRRERLHGVRLARASLSGAGTAPRRCALLLVLTARRRARLAGGRGQRGIGAERSLILLAPRNKDLWVVGRGVQGRGARDKVGCVLPPCGGAVRGIDGKGARASRVGIWGVIAVAYGCPAAYLVGVGVAARKQPIRGAERTAAAAAVAMRQRVRTARARTATRRAARAPVMVAVAALLRRLRTEPDRHNINNGVSGMQGP